MFFFWLHDPEWLINNEFWGLIRTDVNWLSKFYIRDKEHAHIPDQTFTEYTQAWTRSTCTTFMVQLWRLSSATPCSWLELQAEWGTCKNDVSRKTVFPESLWVRYTMTEPKMYNRSQQVSENDTSSYGSPLTLTHFFWMGEGGGEGYSDGDDDDDYVKVSVCVLWLSQRERSSSCPAQCKALRVTYCSWWCQDTHTQHTHTLRNVQTCKSLNTAKLQK